MSFKHVNPRKIERMAVLAFKNGLRLHSDSVVLFERGSHASAYLVSVLAMEELGKSMDLEFYLWNNAVNGRASPELEREILALQHDHRHKQAAFARHTGWPEMIKKGGGLAKRFLFVSSGNLEGVKHAATYVGLKRKGRAIDYHGRVVNPLRFPRRKAVEQITLVNDFLAVNALSVIKGVSSPDIEQIDALFTHRFVSNLRTSWPTMSPAARRRLSQLSKFEDDDER